MGFRESILDYLHDLIYILTAVVLLCLICFRVVVVSGSRMYNTLLDGDYLLLISNVLYHDPQPGDIVVASKESFDNGAPSVKRVIATEGQIVDIDFEAGIVYVDGVALEEDYTYENHQRRRRFFPSSGGRGPCVSNGRQPGKLPGQPLSRYWSGGPA